MATSKKSRTKFTTGFKVKVPIEVLKEQKTLALLSAKHDLNL